MSDSITIARCTLEQRAESLRLLHTALPTDQQNGLVQTLKSIQGQANTVFDGLLIATTAAEAGSEKIIGAAWAQLSAGQTAVVWLPTVNCPAARDLLTAVATYLDEHRVTLAQFLASPLDTIDTELLDFANFQKLADLAYLTVDCQPLANPLSTSQPSTNSQPESALTFLANAGNESEQLGQLLTRTYVDSQDCPELNGVRSLADVLDGYREQGTYAPERWFFIQHEGQNVGALILTAYADTGNWELVYMGLVPAARGHGWGQQILDFALWQAGQGGAERLVLAVDEANSFALKMYQQAGFVTWDRRTVYARLRS